MGPYSGHGPADFYSISVPIPGLNNGVAGIGAVVTVDRYGNLYAGASAGLGYPGGFGAQMGWMVEEGKTISESKTPSEQDLQKFLEGGSVSVGAGGGVVVAEPGNGRGGPSAVTLTTPGVGASYSWRFAKIPGASPSQSPMCIQ